MTKYSEKLMFAAIVNGCPAGYVKDILSGITAEIENAIDSDYTFVDLRGLIQAQRAAQLEHEALRFRLSELNKQIDTAQFRLNTINNARNNAAFDLRALAAKIQEIVL